jgi:hypothetical protein
MIEKGTVLTSKLSLRSLFNCVNKKLFEAHSKDNPEAISMLQSFLIFPEVDPGLL